MMRPGAGSQYGKPLLRCGAAKSICKHACQVKGDIYQQLNNNGQETKRNRDKEQ